MPHTQNLEIHCLALIFTKLASLVRHFNGERKHLHLSVR